MTLAAFTRSGESGWFGKLLSRLGDWSYGLYLLHPFTMKLVASHVSGGLGFSLALGLAILAAAVVHRWIEEPLGRLGRVESAALDLGIKARPTDVLLDLQSLLEGREGALLAVRAFAEPAGDSDRNGG